MLFSFDCIIDKCTFINIYFLIMLSNNKIVCKKIKKNAFFKWLKFILLYFYIFNYQKKFVNSYLSFFSFLQIRIFYLQNKNLNENRNIWNLFSIYDTQISKRLLSELTSQIPVLYQSKSFYHHHSNLNYSKSI